MALLGCKEIDKNLVYINIKFPTVCVCFLGPRRDRCSSADRLTVCAAIVVDGHLADVRSSDNPVGPETKPEGSYCQGPV